MAKLKDYPSVKEKGIDADSDASGNNGTNLLITGWTGFKTSPMTAFSQM